MSQLSRYSMLTQTAACSLLVREETCIICRSSTSSSSSSGSNMSSSIGNIRSSSSSSSSSNNRGESSHSSCTAAVSNSSAVEKWSSMLRSWDASASRAWLGFMQWVMYSWARSGHNTLPSWHTRLSLLPKACSAEHQTKSVTTTSSHALQYRHPITS